MAEEKSEKEKKKKKKKVLDMMTLTLMMMMRRRRRRRRRRKQQMKALLKAHIIIESARKSFDSPRRSSWRRRSWTPQGVGRGRRGQRSFWRTRGRALILHEAHHGDRGIAARRWPRATTNATSTLHFVASARLLGFYLPRVQHKWANGERDTS